jgi:hypothetical protein
MATRPYASKYDRLRSCSYVFEVMVDMHLDVGVWWKWGTQKSGELVLALATLGQQLIDHSGERLDLIAQMDNVAVAGHLAALGVRAIGLGM